MRVKRWSKPSFFPINFTQEARNAYDLLIKMTLTNIGPDLYAQAFVEHSSMLVPF
jgi:hypothetical protein